LGEENAKKLKGLKARFLEYEKKLKKVEADVEQKDVILKETESEISTICHHVIAKHVKGFQKALMQVKFLYIKVSTSNYRFNIDMDVYENRLLDVD